MKRSSFQQSKWMRLFPPASWLADYRLAWLRSDAIAGITLAAYAIPVSLAYAGLAGLPPQVGIYGYLLGGLGYALLGSSRQLAVGPTSAISLMIAGTVGAMADGDPQRYAQIASLAAFTVAAAVPDRLAVAAERAGEADQRQHPGRLQGRCGVDHRHDPAAEPVRRCRRRPQFFRAGVSACRAARPDSIRSCLRLASSRSCCSARRALAAGKAGGARRCRAVDRRGYRCWGFPRLACRHREKSRRAYPRLAGPASGCVTSKELFRWPPAVCCWPISKVCLRRALLQPSTDTRWICGRSFWGSARQISPRRWAMAIP